MKSRTDMEVLAGAISAIEQILLDLDGAAVGVAAAPLIDHGMHLLVQEHAALLQGAG